MPLNYDDGQSRYDNGTSTWADSAQFPVAPVIGSQADFFARIKALIPRSWFAVSSNFDATLQAPALALSLNYAQVMYAKLQMRIKTSIDGFLDIVANDYFGATLLRLGQEGDDSFRNRILANLFVKGPTRKDMSNVLTLLTGRTPAIFEPSNPSDTGGWDAGGFYFDAQGGWGDPLPYQSMVTAYRPLVSDVSLGELDSYRFSLDGNGYWSDAQPESVSDAAIIAAVEATRALGTIVWLRIADQPVIP